MKTKLLYYYIFILLGLFLNMAVVGQTATLTPKVSPTEKVSQNDAIQDLKEKVANKVNEIRKKNNRAVAGEVLEISPTSTKIKTDDQEDFVIKLDETLTKYYQISGAQQKEIDAQDIEKDDYVIATGVISDKTITANSVFVDQRYLVGSGKISEVDKDNFIVKVISPDKSVYNLNIETFTKQQIVNIKTLEIERIGFSKIIEGDSIHFTVKVVGNEKNNEYSTDKILIVPQEYFIK